MKTLSYSEVKQVSGAGFWGYMGSAFGGFLLSDYFFSPVRDTVVNHFKSEHNRLVIQFKQNNHSLPEKPITFNGDF